MGKKFIIVNGKKHFMDDLEIKDADVDTEDKTPAAEPEADASTDQEIEKTAKSLGKALRAELGIDDLKAAQERTNTYLNQHENTKLKQLLHGKDLIKDKDSLTAEEKIVGFFHALVSKDEVAVKALSEGVNADGGYLFPTEFVNELVRPLVIPPRMRAFVRVVTMTRNTLTVPTLANRPKVYWTAENAAKNTTTANFAQVVLTARKAAAILYASDELIEDSANIDVVRTIIDLFSEAIGIEEDRVILTGNGTTEPTGIKTAVSASTIPSVTCVGNLSFDNILALIYALKQQYRPGASFLIHPENVAELRKLKDSNGRYLWTDPSVGGGTGLTENRPATILGYPVYEFYDVPSTAIYFGNWKLAYWLGDRKQMTVKITQDSETAFVHDQTGIRVVERIGGNVVLGEAARALVSIP